MSRSRDWIELARASNLPTIWTNVLVGAVAGGAAGATLPWRGIAFAMIGLSAVYLAGMILNDVADARRDATIAPGRPIPSGRIGRGAAGAAGVALLGLGVALVGLAAPAALPWVGGLALLVLAYDLLHGRCGGFVAATLMGLCRAAVPVVAAVACGPVERPRLLATIAAAALLLVFGITLLARGEAEEPEGMPRRRGLLLALPAFLPLAAAMPLDAAVLLLVLKQSAVWLLGLGVVALAPALARPPRLRAAIGGALASICLADALALAIAGGPLPLLVACEVLFLLVLLAHRRVPGT